ncbi:hypothetical protein BDZ89DRAFT_1080622, partial [Hymenopellis radicata]
KCALFCCGVDPILKNIISCLCSNLGVLLLPPVPRLLLARAVIFADDLTLLPMTPTILPTVIAVADSLGPPQTTIPAYVA